MINFDDTTAVTRAGLRITVTLVRMDASNGAACRGAGTHGGRAFVAGGVS